MTQTPNLLEIAAQHLAALLQRIAGSATKLITTAATLSPGHLRASCHVARVIELCALLIVRLATNPAYQAPLPPEPDEDDFSELDEHPADEDKDAPDPESADRPEPPELPESPERPERPDRLDTPPPGAKLSTLALVAEIRRQLQLAATALGHPLPTELDTLCREAIAAAMHLEHTNLMNLVTRHRRATPNTPAQNHPTEPPAPKPATTLEL